MIRLLYAALNVFLVFVFIVDTSPAQELPFHICDHQESCGEPATDGGDYGPGGCFVGDVNGDGEINLLDVFPYIQLVISGEYQCEADINVDGSVNLFDANPFVALLLESQSSVKHDPNVRGPGDFFWSTAGLNGGAVNEELILTLSPGKSAELFLYYTTNGPADSEMSIGAGLNVSISETGVIEFLDAQTFDFTITIGGVDIGNRWLDGDGGGGSAGEASSISADQICDLTAFTVTGGEGIFDPGPFFDQGYDADADAFLFGSVEISALAEGQVSLITGENSLGVVNKAVLVDATFANAIVNVVNEVLLGDVNLDGFVNLLDVECFIDRIATKTYQAEADCNEDGVVDLMDVDPFVTILSGE